MNVQKFLQQLTASGVSFTVLRSSLKKGTVIKVSIGGGNFAFVRVKNTSITV